MSLAGSSAVRRPENC